MDWTGKKVLVTGAAGFIGSHLCERLVELGAEVTAMVHYNALGAEGNLAFIDEKKRPVIKVLAGEIQDGYFVSRAVRGQAAVFHLAALIGIPYSYAAPLAYVRTNVEGTLNVLEAARAAGTERVVHTSTSETYGSAQYVPIDERHPLQGQSPYSASKIGADKLAESYFASFGLKVATVRPFNTYGPRQSARAIIPTIITQALTRPKIALGSLFPVRDLNFVKDTVEGFLAIAESDSSVGQVTNIGSGKGISVGDLAARILNLMDLKKPIEEEAQRVRPEASEVTRLLAGTERILQTTRWKPHYSLDAGLQETIAFIMAHRHLYNAHRYTV